MVDEFKKIGWKKIEPSDVTAKKLNELILYSDSIIKDNKKKFGKSDFADEIIKSSFRSILRYSNKSKEFVKSLAKDLVEYNSELKNFYLTPPYIIVHKPNDLKEKGDFHIDTLKFCGKSYTSWTPINDYEMNYAALSFLNKSHTNYLGMTLKILKKIKFSHNFKKILRFLFIKPVDLIVKKNSSYLWHSDLIHKGNLNPTNRLHSALVTRITENPLYYEPTEKISEIIISKNLSNNLDKISFDHLTSVLFKICQIAKEKIDFFKYANDLKNNTDENLLKHISFSLSILSQRFQNELSSNLDLISCILTSENLVSLERVLANHKNQDISERLLKEFSIDKNLSYQKTIIIKKFKNQSIDNLETQKKLGWI